MICISDFALHSIGVVLFRNNLIDIYDLFIKNFIPDVYILTLSKNKYSSISKWANKYKLDFDDSYQLSIANEFKLTLITLDSDFKNLPKEFKITIL